MITHRNLLDYCRQFNTESWFDFMRLWLTTIESSHQRWNMYQDLVCLARDTNSECLEQAIEKMLGLYKRIKQFEHQTGEHLETLFEAWEKLGGW